MKGLSEVYDVDKDRIIAYRSSTKVITECLHRTLNSKLGKAVDESQRDSDTRVAGSWLHTGRRFMKLPGTRLSS